MLDLGLVPGDTPLTYVDQMINVFAANARLMRSYTSGVCNAPILLVKATQPTTTTQPRLRADEALTEDPTEPPPPEPQLVNATKWEPHTRDTVVEREVETTHVRLIDETHAPVVARHLEPFLPQGVHPDQS